MPRFKITLDHGIRVYRDMRLISYMVAGNCDNCKFFWQEFIEPRIGYPSYHLIGEWVEDKSCDVVL